MSFRSYDAESDDYLYNMNVAVVTFFLPAFDCRSYFISHKKNLWHMDKRLIAVKLNVIKIDDI